MSSTLLEFNQFGTPHTGDAACQFIDEVIKDWGFEKSLMAIKTDYASDMINSVRKLNEKYIKILLTWTQNYDMTTSTSDALHLFSTLQ